LSSRSRVAETVQGQLGRKPRAIWGSRQFLFKAILILSSFALDHDFIAERVSHFGWSPGLLLFVVEFAIFAGLMILVSLIRSTIIRIAFAIIFAVATLVVSGFQNVAGATMRYFDFVTVVTAQSALPDALAMYSVPLVRAVIAALLVLLGCALPPKRGPSTMDRIAIAGPVVGLVSLWILLLTRGGEGASALPPAWIGLGYSGVYAYHWAHGAAGAREPVRMARSGTPVDGDIVLIIDESVAGQYLDINGKSGVRSGLGTPIEGMKIANFGLATSITNCSVGSNVMLRFGGTRRDPQRQLGKMPSIWSYAKAAGLSTAYLYAQRGGRYENRMTDLERQDIDRSYYFEDSPAIERDQRVADRLAVLLSDKRPDFILVNKKGSHFPVNNAYPPSYAKYAPALPRSRGALRGSDERRWRSSIVQDAADWRLYRNSYRNALTWTVGRFFDRLFAHRPFDGATIIYTSDHGQDLHERERADPVTHCRSDPVMEEGVVPLVVIESETERIRDWAYWADRNHNGMSHYRIFPTLLELMGYDPGQVRKAYGDPLDSASPDPYTFATELQLDGQSKPRWHRVNLKKIAFPSERDIAN